MKPLLVTSGEPAGVGPDICLALADTSYPVVVLGDKALLEARAQQLNVNVRLLDYTINARCNFERGSLYVLSLDCPSPVESGVLNLDNVSYVMAMLSDAAKRVSLGEFSGLVTAPVHKGIINEAGVSFTGHTEFFAEYCKVPQVVMMLVSNLMKVALVTTHLPLRQVPDALTIPLLKQVMLILSQGLHKDFGISIPRIHVAGLNPHAGEAGHLGREEIEVIEPAIKAMRAEGIDARGPFSADTLFIEHEANQCDAFLVMYHDQGLPVIKYTDFGEGVNVTLGLPIIRTSVDHGTALSLAGTGKAHASSLIAAVSLALSMAQRREPQNETC